VAVALAAIANIESSPAQDAVAAFRRPGPDLVPPVPRVEHNDRGFSFPIVYTTNVFGNVAGGVSRGAVWEELFKAGVVVDLGKAVGWPGASAAVNLLYPHGSSLTREHVHDLNTLSNIDSYDSVRLYDAWFQQEFAGGKLSMRIGQLLADAEFFASDYGALFINSSFGAIPLVSQNLTPPIFPVAAPGLRLRVSPTDSFYIQAAVFSGDVGDPARNNKHNLRLSFRGEDGALVFGEIGYKFNAREAVSAPSPKETPAAATRTTLSGSYTISGYLNSKEFPNNRRSAAHDGNYAVYFIADQELWHPGNAADRGLSIFARIGAAPEDRNTVSFYADAGFNYKGIVAGREEDVFGIGFSYTQLSSDLRDATTDKPLESHDEEVMELTYEAVLNEHVSLQPDIQFIFNPGAVKRVTTAIVGGLRLTVKF
jgi:porin